MNAVSKNIQAFKNVLRVICKLAPEVTITASNKYLKIQAASPDHLVLFMGKIKPSFFEEYEHDEKNEISICLETNSLRNVLSRLVLSDPVELEVSQRGLAIKLHKPCLRFFLLKPKKQWEILPKFRKFESEVLEYLQPEIFYEIVSDASKVADEITIRVAKDSLGFEAESASCEFVCEQEIRNSTIKNLSCTVMTSLLASLIPLAKECDRIVLGLARGKPLVLRFVFEEGQCSFTLLISTRDAGCNSSRLK